MAIRFACPSCETRYTVNDRAAGKVVECKTCGQLVQVSAVPQSETPHSEGLIAPTSFDAASYLQPSRSLPIATLLDDSSERIRIEPGNPHTELESDSSTNHVADQEFAPAQFTGQLPPIPKCRRMSLRLVVGGASIAGLILIGVLAALLFGAFDGFGGSAKPSSVSGLSKSCTLPKLVEDLQQNGIDTSA